VATHKAWSDQSEGQARRRDPLCALRWEELTRFLDDGRIKLDNSPVERSIRPIILNRKNALFAGSDGGAEHCAVIASVIETCKLNDVDPLA
jgi:transposase